MTRAGAKGDLFAALALVGLMLVLCGPALLGAGAIGPEIEIDRSVPACLRAAAARPLG
jgi:hypothetical protein